MRTLPIFWRKPGLSLAPGMLRYLLKLWTHEVFWILKICHWVWNDFFIAKSTNKCSVFIWPDLSADHSLLLNTISPLLWASLASNFLEFSYARDSFFSPLPDPSLLSSFLTLQGSGSQVIVPFHSIFILLVTSLLDISSIYQRLQ